MQVSAQLGTDVVAFRTSQIMEEVKARYCELAVIQSCFRPLKDKKIDENGKDKKKADENGKDKKKESRQFLVQQARQCVKDLKVELSSEFILALQQEGA